MKKTLAFLLTLAMLCMSVCVPAFAENADQVSVTVLATSDLHGWFVPWDFATDTASTRGSFTYLATVINNYRSANENTILVDCGDTTQSNYVEYFIGKEKNPMIELMNAMNYEVWTFGNHEYNFSRENRQALIDGFQGATLSGNVMEQDGTPYLPATALIERGGVKLGFVGFTTPMIAEFEKNSGTLADLTVLNPLDVAQQAIDDLKAQGADCIIGLIHEGLNQENSVPGTGTLDLANAFPEFDVIISGHAHKAVESETENGVLLCEPYYYGRSLSVVNLTFEPTETGYRLVEKSAVLEACGKEEDAEMVALLQPYKEELSGYVRTPIGTLLNQDLNAPDVLPGISAANVQSVGILNLMSTAGIYYAGVDCTLLNTDYEHPGFPVGDISIKDIASSYSFTGGEVCRYPITGAQLKTIMEWSAGYFNQVQEGDLTISYTPERRESKYSSNFVGGGMTYVIDLTQPVGSRIQDLAIIEKDALGNPVYDENGAFKTTPVTDDTPILLGTNSYYMDQWQSAGGCLEGETFTYTYSSTNEFGDDGTVRNLTIRYIREVLDGVVDGSLYNYIAWHAESGVDQTSEAYLKCAEMLENGTLTLPASESGRTNIAPITVSDVEAASK